jgi:hypothetical protein
MDFPGHFKRRIKSVSISIPCIAGPYTGVNATLRLLNNKFRNIAITNKYPDAADESFISYNIPITAIATSSAQNDAGMFELNFKDERYLPFEGAGVISRWRIELPSGFQQFDYYTISDIIMHLRYTSVDGGDNLKKSAAGTVQDFVKSNVELSEREGLFALFDLKNDFPNEYYKFTQTPPSNDKIAFNLGNLSERLPIFTKNYTISAADATLWITSDLKSDKVICPLSSSMDHWTLQIDNKGITSLDRIWLIVRYTLSKKLK